MNVREKVLVILLGVAIAAFVGRTAVRKYAGALKEYNNRISKLNKDLNKIELERAEANIAQERWRKLGLQTFSMDVNEATTRLRDELNELAEQANLREIAVALSGRPAPWGDKNGLQVLNCSVKGEGELDEILKFFFHLHTQPYAVRCKSLSLSQTRSSGNRRNRKDNKDTGLLKMSAQLDTLIFPANQMVPRITPAVLEKNKRKTVIRPMLANISDYKPLLNKRLFKPYEPPPPPPPPKPSNREHVRRADDRKPEPKPEPPPEDAHMVLRGLLSSPRGQLTVLEKPGKGSGEDEYKEVGDKMFGGKLIYVHPKGAVTEKNGEKRFHAIGQELQDFVPLTEEDQPVIYHELLKLEHRSVGISQGSG